MKKLEELNLKDKKVIIFDMDGTLIDSIGIWNMTDQKMIHDYAGKDVSQETIQADRDYFLNNNPSSDIYTAYCQYLIDKYGLSVKDPRELSNIRKNISNEVLSTEIGFKPDVSKLILKLKDLGYKLALATVSTREQIEIYYKVNQKMLAEMNIEEVFDFITTKETVKNKKPDPEVYNVIMEHFNVKPEDCLIFEDSYTGVLAANNAGIEVVNVYDKYSDVDRDKINELTDYSIQTYGEFIDGKVKATEEELDESHVFKIGLPKYQDENRYLTEWEKQMKKDIDSIITSELKQLIEEESKPRQRIAPIYKNNPAACELYRSKKQEEYEREYRDNYTLKNLKQCGLDIQAFEKTWMCVCARSSILLGCIQDKLDGFYYDEQGQRIQSGHPMKLEEVQISYKDGILTICDESVSHEFYVDEHQIIYVNGENVLNLVPVPTKEEENQMIRDLMKDMEMDRIQHERRMERSMKFAKEFYSD